MDTSTGTHPTPENPLVLSYTGHTPSLKNRRRPVKEGGRLKLKKNMDVTLFLRRTRRLIEQQWAKQSSERGFSLLNPPKRIGVYVEIVFYRNNPLKLPASDGDNSYTTIQETLKKLVVKDDNQVGFGSFEVLYTSQRSLEHATAYIWFMDEGERGAEQFMRFWSAKQQRERQAQDDLGIPELLRQELFGS